MLIGKVKTDLVRSYKNIKELDKKMADVIFRDVPILRQSLDEDDLIDEDEFEELANRFTNLELGYNYNMKNYFDGERGVTYMVLNDPIIYEAEIRYNKLNRKNRSKKKYPDKITNELKKKFSYAYEILQYDFCGTSEYVHASFRPYYRPTRMIVLYMHCMIDLKRLYECIYYLFCFIYHLKQFVIEFDNAFCKEDVA